MILDVAKLASKVIRYGEVMDVNLPRDKATGKTKGFGFVMYEDQRSTVLAVDNLNGAKVLEKTLRVDHVKNYKQKRTKNDEGEWVDPEEQSLNAKPEMIMGTSTCCDNFLSSRLTTFPAVRRWSVRVLRVLWTRDRPRRPDV